MAKNTSLSKSASKKQCFPPDLAEPEIGSLGGAHSTPPIHQMPDAVPGSGKEVSDSGFHRRERRVRRA